MITSPIIPIEVMTVICVILLFLKRRGILNFIRQIIIVVLLFILNLRIMIPTETTEVYQSEVDVLFVFDNTVSMLAEDYNVKSSSKNSDRRIDGAKEAVKEIVEAFPNSRFALVSFSNRAEYLVPYTYEEDIVLRAVDNFNAHGKFVAEGTSLNMTYEPMEEALKNSSKYDEDDRIKLVFFLSDGENTKKAKNEELAEFDELEEYIHGGAVLGFGTKEGGKMHIRITSGDNQTEVLSYYNEKFDYVPAISKIDEDNLEEIADGLGVDYYHITKDRDIEDVIDSITSSIESGEISAVTEQEQSYYELYWIFAAAIAVLLFVDFVYYRVKMSRE